MEIEYCRRLISKTKIIYDKIGQVYSPALKENVSFNAKGFHHLLYESDGTPRTVSERIYKLTLFPLAKAVIENAKNIDGERTVKVRASRKKKDVKLKEGKAYSLVARVGKKAIEVRVILLKIGNGKLAFRSIMKN